MSHFEEAERADLSPTAEDVDLAKEDAEDLTNGDLAQEDGEDAEDESEDAEDESEDAEDESEDVEDEEEEDTSKGLTEVPPCAEGLPPTPPPVVEATPQPMLEVANVS